MELLWLSSYAVVEGLNLVAKTKLSPRLKYRILDLTLEGHVLQTAYDSGFFNSWSQDMCTWPNTKTINILKTL